MATLRIRNLDAPIGADVEGLDLDEELDDESIRLLRQAFDERAALVIRDTGLSPADQRYLAGLVVGAEAPRGREAAEANSLEYPVYISNKEENGNAPYGRLLYHSDMMWSDTPMELLSLYGLEVDQPSVPTVFANAVHAWETLPNDLRARVEGLKAVHATGQRDRGGYSEDELLQPIREQESSTTKPIGNPHPRTGKTILYVCQMMTSHIEDMPADESEALLEELFEHLYSETNSWQHDWRTGDLVLWDNLALQHARPVVELEGPTRTLRKVIAPVPAQTSQTSAPRYSKAG